MVPASATFTDSTLEPKQQPDAGHGRTPPHREGIVVTRTSAHRSGPGLDTGGRIVVGVDPGGRSTSAVLWAAEEAERTGGSLHLVSAYPTEDARAYGGSARSNLAGLARRLTLADLRYEGRIGSTVGVLLDAADQGSMLVVGRRGYGGAQRRLTDSVSMAVASRCRVPVIVAPEPWLQPSMATAPLVVGVDAWRPGCDDDYQGPDPATAALDFSFDRADRLRVPLIVVHAADNSGLDGAVGERDDTHLALAKAALEARLEPWFAARPDVEVVVRCVAGSPRQALIDAAEVAQLTVLGRRADNQLGGRQLGPTARGFVHQARRPVALVPATVVAARTSRVELDDAGL
jgi:nucleotide-binding universal stress UspA family protein